MDEARVKFEGDESGVEENRRFRVVGRVHVLMTAWREVALGEGVVGERRGESWMERRSSLRASNENLERRRGG
jgi:hypothetical protein